MDAGAGHRPLGHPLAASPITTPIVEISLSHIVHIGCDVVGSFWALAFLLVGAVEAEWRRVMLADGLAAPRSWRDRILAAFVVANRRGLADAGPTWTGGNA